MKVRPLIWLAAVSVFLGNALVPSVFSDEPGPSEGSQPAGSALVGDGKLSIDVARERATVTQDIYAATLRMLHQRYFHQDKRVLPARAMQDIFDDIENQSSIKARWISASLKPMSIDHTPESDFEKKAAKEIAAGTPHLEVVEGGYYRRAIAIPLTSGCLGCHEGLFQNNGRKKFAALVVSMPFQNDTEQK